jgi:Ca2+-binding EF-hand superfamily protein
MLNSRTIISLFAFTAAGAGTASVIHTPQDVGSPKATDVLVEQIRPGIFLEQYIAQLVSELRQADRDGNGLDAGDVKLARNIAAAQARASVAGELLRQDLDGDLVVTREEIEQAARRSDSRYRPDLDRQLGQFDRNGDGRITITEALAARRERRPSDRLDALLALAPNGNGRITARELRSLAEKTFAAVDDDGDDKISEEEYRRIAPQVQAAQSARMAPVCGLPEAPVGARVVLFGTYEANALSSAVIGGQDKETNLMDVTIEPGTEPLYIVLTSYESMVWRFNGAAGRVARVVVSSVQGADNGISASGVMGVPASKVTIGEPNCPRYFSKLGSESAGATATVRRSIDREPNSVFATYSAQQISLPSGQIIKATHGSAPLPRGFDAQMWSEASRYWEAGLVQVDPRHVVTKARAEPYKVYPSQMGLAQLLGSGAIERNASGYRIVRPIPRMPPSMGGAHSVKMTVAKGVPLPPGDPVHTCVTIEDTGEAIGPTCRMGG